MNTRQIARLSAQQVAAFNRVFREHRDALNYFGCALLPEWTQALEICLPGSTTTTGAAGAGRTTSRRDAPQSPPPVQKVAREDVEVTPPGAESAGFARFLFEVGVGPSVRRLDPFRVRQDPFGWARRARPGASRAGPFSVRRSAPVLS